jgi:hypothetical protein
MNNDPTNHDCHLSPDSGCSTCEAIYNASQKQESAPKRPDYSFERTGCYADYPAGFNLI